MYTRQADKPASPAFFASSTTASFAANTNKSLILKTKKIIDMLEAKALLMKNTRDIERDSESPDQHDRYKKVHELVLNRNETALAQNEFNAASELINNLLDEYENVDGYRLKIAVVATANSLTINAIHCYPMWENEPSPYPAPVSIMPFYTMKTRIDPLMQMTLNDWLQNPADSSKLIKEYNDISKLEKESGHLRGLEAVCKMLDPTFSLNIEVDNHAISINAEALYKASQILLPANPAPEHVAAPKWSRWS